MGEPSDDHMERPQPVRPPELPDPSASIEGEQPAPIWDGLDESVWESFPASDAPASWAGRDRGGPTAIEDDEDESPLEST